MAVTETPPETVDAAAETSPSAPRPQATGLAAVLGSGDHKVIGRLYIVSALLLGAVVLVLGQLFAVEALKPETLDVFTSDTAYQLFTLTRLGTLFLLALPLIIGVAMVVVPLQVGSRAIAFPRAAAASYWGWLLGSALLIASYIANGGPGGGSSAGVDLWIASLGLIVVSVLLAAVCLATTVITLRTPGLYLSRVPLFAWSVLVAAIMWLVTLPVLFGLLVLMYVDHRHAGGISIGNPLELFGNVGFVLRNPMIYVVTIPVLGFVGDVLLTSAKGRSQLRPIAQAAIGLAGITSFGAFLVVPDKVVLESVLVIGLSVLAVLPPLLLVAVAGDSFRRNSVSFNGGLVFAVAAWLVLLVTVAAGALGTFRGVLDAPDGGTVSDNIFFLGVSHGAVLATVIAALGGIYWWATKVGRQPANDKLAPVAALLLLVGALLTVVPDLISGIVGTGAELAGDYTGGITGLNAVVVAGVALVGLGTLVAAVAFLPLLRRSDGEVPADPWEGHTLEWATASPPPVGNFDDDLAPVTSAEPLIDLREEK